MVKCVVSIGVLVPIRISPLGSSVRLSLFLTIAMGYYLFICYFLIFFIIILFIYLLLLLLLFLFCFFPNKAPQNLLSLSKNTILDMFVNCESCIVC